MPEPSCFLVRLEFKRVQTFLFSVPRLRAMLGANALLGETIRLALCRLAESQDAALPLDTRELEALFLDVPDFASEDPLGPSQIGSSLVSDNPVDQYKQGILSRDGGHFAAVFNSEPQAQLFIAEAMALVADQLPDLAVGYRLSHWENGSGWVEGPPITASSRLRWETLQPGDHETCRLAGQGVATATVRFGKAEFACSYASLTKVEAGHRFYRGRTQDIVGLLSRENAGTSAWPCQGCHAPEDLEQLAGGPGRYLAMVHADGNGIGKRVPANTCKTTIRDWLAQEAKIERFFHSMRVATRIALGRALHTTFAHVRDGVRPFQVLMVGGDDLLLVCQAQYALNFVNAFASELTKFELADPKPMMRRPMSIGAGVVICRPTMPIHSMHAMAEELASSAKRLSRSQENASASVVDWTVTTNSMVGAIDAHRRRHDVVCYNLTVNGNESPTTETLILSRKPYRILAQPGLAFPSLASLLRAGENMRASHTARSPWKGLPQLLRRGRRIGQQAYMDVRRKLPPLAVTALEGAAFKSEAWTKVSASNDCWITGLQDFVEVYEIPRLGAGQRTAPDGSEAPDHFIATPDAGADA